MTSETDTSIYKPNQPPRSNSSIGEAQDPFLINFMQLYNAFKVNHIQLDALSDLGNHTIIQLIDQQGQFQTDVGEISIYAKEVVDQTDQLFFRYQGNTPEFQFSNFQIFTLNAFPTQFFTFLPGGLIVYFGSIAVNLASPFEFTLRPSIAKNIMTATFCPLGATPSYPPIVSVQTPGEDGIISILKLTNSFAALGTLRPPNNLFYIILANT